MGAPTEVERVRGRPRVRGRLAELRVSVVRGPAVGIFLWSRAAIWAGALFAWLVFEPNRHPNAARWDDPTLTRDLGWVTDVWARWDSVWFLRIAVHGYGEAHGVAAAFYPLYPLTLAGLGRVFGGHYVAAGIVISLAAALAAFVLLYRLTETRLGADGARRAVLYLAVFPMALFLGAVYCESLFLALAIGAFLLGERGRWLGAGVATGLAMLTRIAGVALLPALVVMAWRRPERRGARVASASRRSSSPRTRSTSRSRVAMASPSPGRRASGTATSRTPAPSAGSGTGCARRGRASSSWRRARTRTSTGRPSRTPTRCARPQSTSRRSRSSSCSIALTVVAWRRFGAPYGLFCAVSLAIPLSVPSTRWPLLSMPRFGLVLFPCFMALAVIGGRPRVHTAILVVSSIMLGVAVTQWALWQWVA